MSQFFSFKRFSLLVLKHWADNKKRYGLSVIAFIGVLIAWFVCTMIVNHGRPEAELQQGTFFLALFATGTFYASQYFRELGSKPKGSNFLLIPASSFEKILCSLLYTMVLFPLVLIGVFYLVDGLMVVIANNTLEDGGANAKVPLVNVFKTVLFRSNSGLTVNFMLFFFVVQSAFLLGSVYFAKYSFIKTIITGFVIWIVLLLLLYFLNTRLFPKGDFFSSGALSYYRVYMNGGNDRLVPVPGWIEPAFHLLVMFVLAPFLWIVSYYRLKEKQV